MWETLQTTLGEFNTVSIIVRLLMAMAFGGVIGLERERRRRPAGFRTYMLVCLGAALVMMTNEFIVVKFHTADPARLGAQVISGIGFLGVGTIIITKNRQVKGLTTAAGLWACACMGLAIGIGFYRGAAVTTLLILIITTIMNVFESRFVANGRTMEIYMEVNSDGSLSVILEKLSKQGIYILNVEIVKSGKSTAGGIAVNLLLKLPKQYRHYRVVEEISRMAGIECVIPV
ncbi:MAG: MgtC/SapB family protein [Lachnospiraceae bacterium]